MSSQSSSLRIAFLAGLLMVPPAPFVYGQDARFHSLPWRSKARLIVPFELIHGEIVVRLSLNGTPPGNFLLDSGSEVIMLGREAANGAHLKIVPINGKMVTPAGSCAMGLVSQGIHITHDKIEINGRAPVIDLSQLQKALGIPVEGILGFEYIRQYPLLLDYTKKTITIFVDKKVRYCGPAVEVPVEARNSSGGLPDLPVVVAQVEFPDGSKASARLEIETGSDRFLTLHAPFVHEHHIAYRGTGKEAAAPRTFSTTFCGDRYELVHGDVSDIQLGGMRFADPEALYAKDPAGVSASNETDGELGNRFLSQFRIFFDIPRDLIVFEQ
jgi:hypothetical protein